MSVLSTPTITGTVYVFVLPNLNSHDPDFNLLGHLQDTLHSTNTE